MDFLVLDFETARKEQWSICQIGLVKYNNGEITKLIDEYVNPQCDFKYKGHTEKHRITANHVKDALTFDKFYPELKQLTQDKIVFNHNSSDEKFFNAACDKFGLEKYNIIWLNSATLVRRTWVNFSQKGYGLENMASHLQIEYTPHNAAEDSRATAIIIEKACEIKSYSIKDWENELTNKFSYQNLVNSNSSKTSNISVNSIDENYIPPENLKGQFIIITLFDNSTKAMLKSLAEKNYGVVQNGAPNGKTTLIIAGNGWPDDAKSKAAKAEKFGLEVFSEEQFLNKVNYTKFINK